MKTRYEKLSSQYAEVQKRLWNYRSSVFLQNQTLLDLNSELDDEYKKPNKQFQLQGWVKKHQKIQVSRVEGLSENLQKKSSELT